MTDLLTWAPIILVIVVVWIGQSIIQAIEVAAAERREDHNEMVAKLGEISEDIGNLEGNVNGLALRYDPPDLSDYQ